MTSFTPSAAGAPTQFPHRHRARRWPLRLAWFFLTVYFLTPPRDVADTSLDRSNHLTYAHFFAERAQWGEEVLPMVGPFGFILYGQTHTGEATVTRYVADLLLKALVAALILHLFRQAGPGALRWIWLGSFLLVVQNPDELYHDSAILFAALVLLAHVHSGKLGWARFATVLLAALALFKGTHFVTATLAFASAGLLGVLERRVRPVLGLAALYVLSLLGFWLLAGQNPLHLPGFFRAVLELSSGYNAVMGLAEPPIIFAAGLALALGLSAALLGFAWFGRRSTATTVALLLLAGFAFIKWKHGFLRADGHVAIFFGSTVSLVLTAAILAHGELLGAPPRPLAPWPRRTALALVSFVAGLGWLGATQFSLPLSGVILARAPEQFLVNLRYLVRPDVFHGPLKLRLEEQQGIADAPQIRAAVGRDPVDFFGYEQGLLLLNHLNYRPRPMGGGSFNVFTPYLQDLNERFVRDPASAPAWQVLKLQTIDDRLPAGDDPLTLRALVDLYRPVLLQRDYLLLQRRAAATTVAAPVVLETRSVRAGEAIPVPALPADRLLLFTIEAPFTSVGRARTFLYRPPELTVRLVSDFYPAGRTFALKPTQTARPVILSPLLKDTADVIRLYGDGPGDRVRSLRLDPAIGFAVDGLRVTFYSAPRPPSVAPALVDELLTYLRYPRFNRAPDSLVTEETGIRELFGEPIAIVHAPGSITWNLRPGDRALVFDYGQMPQSYLGAQASDGVEFNVELLWPPSDGRILAKDMRRPRTVPADRGLHRLHLPLPPYEPGAQLRIRTHPGPDNDGAFDQALVTRVQIQNGPLDASQFNGLGVVPLDRRLPRDAIAGIDNRPVYLVHAPGEVSFPLPPAATAFTAEIGLLPGAYTHGGASDGVEFTLVAVEASGARHTLWSRLVAPNALPSDRGPQAIRVPLPPLAPGTHLTLTTGVGPHGDRGWDQSYVAHVRFE